jgi:hypothetical protein
MSNGLLTLPRLGFSDNLSIQGTCWTLVATTIAAA